MSCGVRIVAAAPGTIEIFGVPPAAPADEWALALGHGLHDLRAALDHLAQIAVRVEGDVPKRPKGVQFPVAETEDDWKRGKAALATAPASLLGRIESVQPLRSDGEMARGLRLLHKLDIRDKHYHLSELQPVISEFSLDDIEDWPDATGQEELWQSPLMRIELSPSLPTDTVGLLGRSEVPVTPLLEVDGKYAVMLDVQRWLYAVIEALVDFVAAGKDNPDLPPEPAWFGK